MMLGWSDLFSKPTRIVYFCVAYSQQNEIAKLLKSHKSKWRMLGQIEELCWIPSWPVSMVTDSYTRGPARPWYWATFYTDCCCQHHYHEADQDLYHISVSILSLDIKGSFFRASLSVLHRQISRQHSPTPTSANFPSLILILRFNCCLSLSFAITFQNHIHLLHRLRWKQSFGSRFSVSVRLRIRRALWVPIWLDSHVEIN